MADKGHLIQELKQRLATVTPLEDEPDFFSSEETVVRFLKSRDWKIDEAEKMLKSTVEYRRRTRPLRVDCTFCHNRPGYHSMRQVGHDEAGRPVIYANFAQASTHRNTAEDTLCHMTYLIENAVRTMAPGISTWVFVIDCTGMTLSSCNPKLGHAVTTDMSNHYPERLGMVICVNHSPVFHGVWKAIKKFLHPQTAAKVKLVRSKTKIADLFSELFSPELATWLKDEITLNKQKPLPKEQLEFWNPPPSGSKSTHDPRGCPTYVTKYLDTFKKQCTSEKGEAGKSEQSLSVLSPSLAAGEPAAKLDERTDTGNSVPRFHYIPHPNIADSLQGKVVRAVALTPEEKREREQAQKMVEMKGEEEAAAGAVVDGEENGEGGAAGGEEPDVEIPGEFQIPANSKASQPCLEVPVEMAKV